MDFSDLVLLAKSVARPRRLSAEAEAGGVGAALLTAEGNTYTGVCIDTACSMGFCAEHAAAAAMVTNGESRIVKAVAVDCEGRILPPCGRCREFLSQLCRENGKALILVAEGRAVPLEALLPHDWKKAQEMGVST